ncbi:MAG: sigma-54-dependent Fis family transcriptional regulator [Deltaproteobacteria bacterium]|nr:sigma-54-dependent Fis family transcriptional regulator [Deltaproteobacteria bacterium]
MNVNKEKPSNEVETVDPVDESSVRLISKRPCLTILYHPDLERIGERLPLFGDRQTGPTALSRLEPVFEKPDGTASGALDSVFVSRKPVWLAKAAAGGVRLSPGSDGTEVVADNEPIFTSRKFAALELERGVVLELARRVVLLLHAAEPVARSEQRLGFVGESQPIEKLRGTIIKVAAQTAPVLLQGESGVGKELAARAIHEISPRADKPFVTVNLAAVPATTAASELFGHSVGAFTGATGEHRGYFRQADGGSLFLDEIGTTAPELQATLLRVIESGEIQPVGAGTPSRVDVRVLAATDEDLETAIEAGSFRAPLYYRLSACQIEIPPLCQRRDDIGRLLIHFLKQELSAVDQADRLRPGDDQQPAWLPARLVAELTRYAWPGNVRELHNVVRQMVIAYADADAVDTDKVLERLNSPGPKATRPVTTTKAAESAQRPAEISTDDLVAAMRRNRFSIKHTAEQLGISRSSLYALIERSDRLRKARDIDRAEMEACLKKCDRDLDAMVEQLEVSKKALKLRLKELGLD